MAISAVAAAVASGSFGINRFRTYRETRALVVRQNSYENGYTQEAQKTEQFRRTFAISMRLDTSAFSTLQSLFTVKGLTDPFYFLPLGETSDIIVRFADPMQVTLVPGGRVDVSTTLVQVE